MKQVKLLSSQFEIHFKHEQRTYDSIVYKYSSGERVYFSACKNGIKYTTIAKMIKFDDEYNVYVMFGKVKLIIGHYSVIEQLEKEIG